MFKRFYILLMLLTQILFVVGQNNTPNESNTHYSLKMEYPRAAEINGIEGTVIVTFDLDKTCSIHNIRQNVILGYGCEDAMFDSLCELENLLKEDFNSTCEPLVDNTLPAVFQLDKEEVSLK